MNVYDEAVETGVSRHMAMAHTAADILRDKGNCVHETCMKSKAVVLIYRIPVQATWMLYARSVYNLISMRSCQMNTYR